MKHYNAEFIDDVAQKARDYVAGRAIVESTDEVALVRELIDALEKADNYIGYLLERR